MKTGTGLTRTTCRARPHLERHERRLRRSRVGRNLLNCPLKGGRHDRLFLCYATHGYVVRWNAMTHQSWRETHQSRMLSSHRTGLHAAARAIRSLSSSINMVVLQSNSAWHLFMLHGGDAWLSIAHCVRGTFCHARAVDPPLRLKHRLNDVAVRHLPGALRQNIHKNKNTRDLWPRR